MYEQLSLLDWRPPAEILPFPLHRSHGATIAVARLIVNMETAKRSGKLNSIRAQTRKRFEPLIGADLADRAADDLVRVIKIGFAYCEAPYFHKQEQDSTVISLLTVQRTQAKQHGNGAGEAGALGQGAKLLAGVGRAHNHPTEYDATRARDGGAA